jgi:hypothetical protein
MSDLRRWLVLIQSEFIWKLLWKLLQDNFG